MKGTGKVDPDAHVHNNCNSCVLGGEGGHLPSIKGSKSEQPDCNYVHTLVSLLTFLPFSRAGHYSLTAGGHSTPSAPVIIPKRASRYFPVLLVVRRHHPSRPRTEEDLLFNRAHYYSQRPTSNSHPIPIQ